MKQLKYIFATFVVALLATSCSKEELPGSESTDEPGQPQTYTFTVSPDLTMEGDAETRSAGTTEEMPTRCFMQILRNNVYSIQTDESIENGKFTFSVELLSNTDYTFLFWADNGSENTPADLREIQYTPGTVAFTAKVVNTPENVIKSGVSLKHAVTKLSLKTTKATSASEGESIKVTTTCATIYNVDNFSASSSSAHTATKTFDASTDFAVNDNIASFYFLPQNETQSVDVEFHLLKQTIENVSLAANTHVTLQGDLSEGNPKWGATKEYAEQQIDRLFNYENGDPKGFRGDDGVYKFYLPEQDLDNFEAVIGAIIHEKVEIQLDGDLTAFEKILEENYVITIEYQPYARYLTILINGTKFYRMYFINPDNYPNFSVVSEELNNNPTE